MSKHNQNSIIPEWDELLSSSLKGNHDTSFSDEFYAFRKNGGDNFFQMSQKIIGSMNRIPSYERFLNISWTEIVDVIAAQISDNHTLMASYPSKDTKLDPVKLCPSEKINLQFNQQPCTVLTTQKRVAYAEATCLKSDSILVLGDDDYVSVYLGRAGFTNITVLDIDTKVLARIKKTAQEESLCIEAHHQDLTQKLPEKLKKDYKLCFMDPFYSSDGIDIFLRSAVILTSRAQNPTFFLSVHLMSLFKDGLQKITQQFSELGVEVVEFKKSFNSYPIPKGTRKVLDIVMMVFIRNAAFTKASKDFNYFTSDALVLRRLPHINPGFEPEPATNTETRQRSYLRPAIAFAFCLTTIMAYHGWNQLSEVSIGSDLSIRKAITWVFRRIDGNPNKPQ